MILLNPFIKEAVGFLHVLTPTGYAPLGTCFFLNLNDSGRLFTYIVTNKHVIEEAKKLNLEVYLRLNRSDILDVDYFQLHSNWVYHTDPAIDLAVSLRVGSRVKTNPVSAAALDVGWLVLDENLQAPLPEGLDVLFIGLLTQYLGHKRNYPVVRQGRLALITDEKIKGTYGFSRYYIAECQAQPGNSGSPLFMPARTPEGRDSLAILGVITGHYPQDQLIHRNGTVQLSTHSGLSLITPAQYVKEILDLDVFVNDRKLGKGAGHMKDQEEVSPEGIPDAVAPSVTGENLIIDLGETDHTGPEGDPRPGG